MNTHPDYPAGLETKQLTENDYIIEVSKMNNNYAKLLAIAKDIANQGTCGCMLYIAGCCNRCNLRNILKEIGEL